jgi:hypothetical protein
MLKIRLPFLPIALVSLMFIAADRRAFGQG